MRRLRGRPTRFQHPVKFNMKIHQKAAKGRGAQLVAHQLQAFSSLQARLHLQRRRSRKSRSNKRTFWQHTCAGSILYC